MGTTTVFRPTAVQKKVLALLKGGAKHVLLYDGSRPGKATVLVMAVISLVLRFAGNLSANDQYLINPVYKTEVMADVAKKPVIKNSPLKIVA
jgi:hypothetical protein